MPPNRVHRATPGPNMPPENWSPYLSEDRGFAPYPRGAPLTPREAFLLREVDRAYTTIRSQVIDPAYLGSITGNEPASGFAYPAGPVFAPSWTPEAPRSQEVISFVEGLDYSVPRFGIEERSPVSNFGRSATALFGPSFAGFEGVRPATAEVEDRGTDYRVRFEVPGVSKELLRLRIGEHSVELRSEESSRERTEERAATVSERPRARFARSLRLPESLLSDKSQAHYEDGILEVVIPKAHPAPEVPIQQTLRASPAGAPHRALGQLEPNPPSEMDTILTGPKRSGVGVSVGP